MDENKLIAEFMGLIIRDKDGNLPTCSQQHKLFVAEEYDKLYLVSPYSPNGPDYHKSWDYLMPVVEKIELQHGCDFIASRRRATRTYDANFMDEVNNYVVYVEGCKDRQEATYKAVVEFIKQYKDG